MRGITLGAWSVLALIYGGLSLLFSDSLIYANLYLISLAWMIYVLHTSKWKWERTSTPAGFRLGRVDIEPGDEGGGI